MNPFHLNMCHQRSSNLNPTLTRRGGCTLIRTIMASHSDIMFRWVLTMDDTCALSTRWGWWDNCGEGKVEVGSIDKVSGGDMWRWCGDVRWWCGDGVKMVWGWCEDLLMGIIHYLVYVSHKSSMLILVIVKHTHNTHTPHTHSTHAHTHTHNTHWQRSP